MLYKRGIGTYTYSRKMKKVAVMNYTNLHTHTVFSDGKYTVEELVQLALRNGLPAIGISDHSFTEFDQRYCMKPGRIGEYLAEIRRVREKYRGQIEVYAGLEWDGYSELPERDEFDYLIGSCHYVRAADGSYHSVDHARDEHWDAINQHFGGDPIAYARTYFDTYEARTRVNRPDILGHFDIVTKFGAVGPEDVSYRKMSVEALEACLQVTPVVELNTKPIVRAWKNEPFPGPFLLKQVLDFGGKVILSSDFHGPEQLTGWFDEGTALLKGLGFRTIVVMRGGKLEEVGIEM